LAVAAAADPDASALPDQVFVAALENDAVVGPRRTQANEDLWYGHRCEAVATISVKGSGEPYVLSLYRLVLAISPSRLNRVRHE
jgi:hypothetical protein